MSNQRFADLLKRVRGERHLSQSDFAAQSGISLDTIRAWEQARYAPDAVTFIKLVLMLATDAEEALLALGVAYEDMAKVMPVLTGAVVITVPIKKGSETADTSPEGTHHAKLPPKLPRPRGR